jgi:hypothetical protein
MLEVKMKILVLILATAVAVSAAETKGGLRFFYCIHAERSCKETAPPVPVAAGNAMKVARRALATKDDFVGFTDAHDTTLQFYAETADSTLVDLPAPELKGSYDTHVSRAQALKLIDGLSPPLARYRAELKLKFVKWQ